MAVVTGGGRVRQGRGLRALSTSSLPSSPLPSGSPPTMALHLIVLPDVTISGASFPGSEARNTSHRPLLSRDRRRWLGARVCRGPGPSRAGAPAPGGSTRSAAAGPAARWRCPGTGPSPAGTRGVSDRTRPTAGQPRAPRGSSASRRTHAERSLAGSGPAGGFRR